MPWASTHRPWLMSYERAGQINLTQLLSAQADTKLSRRHVVEYLLVHPGVFVEDPVRYQTHFPSNPTSFEALVAFYPFLCACSLRYLRATPIKHHDRGLTLVFGSDGQISLIGFDSGIPTQPPGVPPTLTVSNTGTHFLPDESPSVSPIPHLEATSTSLTGTSSFTITTTSIPSSLTSSSYDPSSTATDTDTYLPSIPTINYPTPTPTAVSDPKDHGVGAPFYLAIVLASISFVGCVAAFIAWWIRSRARKHDLELDDPWRRRDTISDAGSLFTDNAHGYAKGVRTQARPYYLPASIVRRSSPDLLAVPHTIPVLEDSTLQNGRLSRIEPNTGDSRHAGSRPENFGAESNLYQNMLPSEATSLHPRPGTERLQTGLSVHESTRTLGRLRVANRVPGDVTSGDEGGMNIQGIPNNARAPPGANYGTSSSVPIRERAVQETHVDQSDQFPREGDAVLESPGPATLSWGRRIDTVAALRHTRRRTPETAFQAYRNPGYGGSWYPAQNGGQSGVTRQAPAAVDQGENKTLANPPPDTLGWTDSLKTSFWQAVDAMTRNRPSDLEPRVANTGNGSRFTPAPQRVASRRSPVSPTRSTTASADTDSRTVVSREAETMTNISVTDQEMLQNMSHSSSRSSSTRTNGLGVPYTGVASSGRVNLHPPRTSHFNHGLYTSIHARPASKADTSSVYSTGSAAARANLQKYGYTDSIPSSWSALGMSRQSQLDLSRLFLPLPRPIPSSSPGPLSITPLKLTSDSSLRTGSASVRTRTTMHTVSDILGSDASTVRSRKSINTAGYSVEATLSSAYSVSRDGTIQSRRNTMDLGTTSLQSSSTTSSMLSRKKGVAKRKRPRPPLRAPSTASSVQSVESGLSIREVAVRRALLERRRRVKAAGSLTDGYEDGPTHGRDKSSPSVSRNLNV